MIRPMIKLNIEKLEALQAGSAQDVKAGIVCGFAISAGIGVGLLSGGIGAIAMFGGMVAPVCGASIGSLFFGYN